MPLDEHLLERRAHLLATRISQRVELLRNAIAPAGSRPPFTEQLSKPEALAWWKRNRQTEYGRRVLERMSPADVMELDVALAQTLEGGDDLGTR